MQKINALMFSFVKPLYSLVTVKPATENRLSLLVEVAQDSKKRLYKITEVRIMQWVQNSLSTKLEDQNSWVPQFQKKKTLCFRVICALLYSFPKQNVNWLEIMILSLKGQYCFDVKPFNLIACFSTKCDAKDTKCYDTCIKTPGHGQHCTIMYEL